MTTLSPANARHAILAGIAVTALGTLFAIALIQGYAPSTGPLVIGTTINPSSSPTLPGFQPGSYSSCMDTDGGISPRTPGATIVISAGAPTSGGNARPILNAITSARNSRTYFPLGGDAYDITYSSGGQEVVGVMIIYPDKGSLASTVDEDQPIGSEPGAVPLSPDAAQQAVLTEHYCGCASSTSTPSYTFCYDQTRLFVGTQLGTDLIEYPSRFDDFMQTAAGASLQMDADYLR